MQQPVVIVTVPTELIHPFASVAKNWKLLGTPNTGAKVNAPVAELNAVIDPPTSEFGTTLKVTGVAKVPETVTVPLTDVLKQPLTVKSLAVNVPLTARVTVPMELTHPFASVAVNSKLPFVPTVVKVKVNAPVAELNAVTVPFTSEPGTIAKVIGVAYVPDTVNLPLTDA